MRSRIIGVACMAALVLCLAGCGAGGVLTHSVRFETVVNCYDGANAATVAVDYTSPLGSTLTVSPTPVSTTLTIPGYSSGQVVRLKVRGTTTGVGRIALTCKIYDQPIGGGWTLLNQSTTDSASSANYSKEITATVP